MSFARCCRWVLALGVLSALAPPSRACYSGLTLIPTADTLGGQTYSVEVQLDGSLPARTADTYILNTELGLTDRLEAGVDVDLSDDAAPRLLFNAKYVLGRRDGGRQALALGVCGVGDGATASPYVVGTRDFGGLRGHLGAIGVDGTARGFVGADRALSARWTVMADYIGGDDNAAALGVAYQHTDRVGLLAGAIFPNAGGETSFTVHLVLAGPLAR